MEKSPKELMEEARKIGQSQVIKCKCGKVFAACMLPFAHIEADWMRDVRKYVKKGHEVDIMKNGSWEWCDTKKCVTQPQKKELTLF